MKNKIWTSFRKYRSSIHFIFIIILIGLFTGVLFYFKQSDLVKSGLILDQIETFSHNVFAFKNIIYHLICLIFILLMSFLLIGLPLMIIYIFMESLALGFVIPLFFSSFKVGGIKVLFSYVLFIKLSYFVLLIIMFLVLLKFVKSYLYYLKYRRINLKSSLKKVILIIVVILINDVMIYFLANKILTFILT